MSVPTTVILDEDVLDGLREESRKRGASFEDTLNDMLRASLTPRHASPDRGAFRVKPTPFGLRPGLSYDDMEALLEHGEGELYR